MHSDGHLLPELQRSCRIMVTRVRIERQAKSTHICKVGCKPFGSCWHESSVNHGPSQGPDSGIFDIPVDHLFAAPVFIDYLSRVELSQNVTIVSPDAGGVERARAYAKRLNADLAIIDKRRSEGGHAEVMHVVGQVKDRVCIIQDDIVDTAGTLQQASQALKDSGAASVMACAVHGVLSGPAFQRIDDSVLEQLIVTNTIPLRDDFARSDKVQVLSVANLLGQAIQSIHQETSVSSLFV